MFFFEPRTKMVFIRLGRATITGTAFPAILRVFLSENSVKILSSASVFSIFFSSNSKNIDSAQPR